MTPKIISVIGALGNDKIMLTDRYPDIGESLASNSYHEALGGKGANAAIAAYRTSRSKTDASIILPPRSAPTVPDTIEAETSIRGEETETSTRSHGSTGLESAIATLSTDHYHTNTNPTVDSPIDGSHDYGADDVQIRMIGSAGEDEYAEKFRVELEKNGVNCSGLKIIKGQMSQVCFNIVEEFTGETRCLFYPGATAAWKPSDFLRLEDLANGPKPDLVVAQMEIPKGVVEQILETAGKHGIDFILNAAPADPIRHELYPYITHLIVNETEAAILSGRTLDEIHIESLGTVADEFLSRGAKNVVITVGEKGAYFASAQNRGHVPAYKVDVVDTTGAGDTFTGAYAVEYLKKKAMGTWDIKSAIERANKACALTIQVVGCQDGIPWSDEIDAFEAEPNMKALTGDISNTAGGLTMPVETEIPMIEPEKVLEPVVRVEA